MKEYTAPKKEVLFLVTKKRNNDGESYMTDTVPFVDVINWTDPVTKEVRERKIRYIKGATTIFADEQPEHYDLKWEGKHMKPRCLTIHNGSHRVHPSETLLMKYLMLCNYNESNPSRKTNVEPLIKVYDAEAIAKKNNDNSILEIRAKAKVIDMDENTLRAHLITTHSGKTMDSINFFRRIERQQLVDMALNEVKKDPKRFLDSFSAPSLRSKYIIINARLRDIIMFNEQTNVLSWPTGDVILNPANGMNAMDALAEFSVEQGRYKDIVEGLREKMLDRMSTAEQKETELSPVAKTDTRDTYDFFIEKAIASGVVVNNFQWFVINKKEGEPEDKEPVKIQGAKKFKEYLKENKDVYLDLMDRVDKATLPA